MNRPPKYRSIAGYREGVPSVSPGSGNTLASQTLEHPSRRAKRAFLERELGRTFADLWHDAPTPEAVGIEFVAGLSPRNAGTSGWLDLGYRKPESGEPEAWVGSGATSGRRFSVPPELLTERPATLEIWWATGARKPVAVVPCYEEGAEPPKLRRERRSSGGS